MCQADKSVQIRIACVSCMKHHRCERALTWRSLPSSVSSPCRCRERGFLHCAKGSLTLEFERFKPGDVLRGSAGAKLCGQDPSWPSAGTRRDPDPEPDTERCAVSEK